MTLDVNIAAQLSTARRAAESDHLFQVFGGTGSAEGAGSVGPLNHQIARSFLLDLVAGHLGCERRRAWDTYARVESLCNERALTTLPSAKTVYNIVADAPSCYRSRHLRRIHRHIRAVRSAQFGRGGISDGEVNPPARARC